MTFIDETTSRQDLQLAILSDNDLYSQVDEKKFLDDGYSTEELYGIIGRWVQEGDECA